MKTSILLVALETRWLGAARMPRALTRAGFEVSLLTPVGSLGAKSLYVARLGNLEMATTQMQWFQAFAGMVRATSPRVVMPCDDRALRMLLDVVLDPPEAMLPALALQLGALVRTSLGDPAHYRTSVSKTRLAPAAEALGIRVPAYRIIATADEALEFAAQFSFPIVVKRDQSSAGDGVEICADADSLRAAVTTLRNAATRWHPASEDLIVQQAVRGRTLFYPSMAWEGKLLTGYAGEKIIGNPEPKGPPTVNRYFRAPELRATVETLAKGLGISGFFSPEFIEDASTGDAYLIEVNRRLVGGAHRGSAIGVDHCVALHAAIAGTELSTRRDLDDGEEHFTVHFPQEWLRDPGSDWLRGHPVDVPWDEPELIEAMLALRNE